MLKVLNVRSVIIYIEWRTTDSWFDVARPILGLILLEKLLQLVQLFLTLLSV